MMTCIRPMELYRHPVAFGRIKNRLLFYHVLASCQVGAGVAARLPMPLSGIA